MIERLDARVAARLAQRAPVVVQTVDEVEPEEPVEPLADDNAPVGPSAEEESAYLAGEMDAGGFSAPRQPAVENDEPEPTGELPALDELRKRVPGEALAIMDELFRAKFTKVQRVPARVLKKQGGP